MKLSNSGKIFQSIGLTKSDSDIPLRACVSSDGISMGQPPKNRTGPPYQISRSLGSEGNIFESKRKNGSAHSVLSYESLQMSLRPPSSRPKSGMMKTSYVMINGFPFPLEIVFPKKIADRGHEAVEAPSRPATQPLPSARDSPRSPSKCVPHSLLAIPELPVPDEILTKPSADLSPQLLFNSPIWSEFESDVSETKKETNTSQSGILGNSDAGKPTAGAWLTEKPKKQRKKSKLKSNPPSNESKTLPPRKPLFFTATYEDALELMNRPIFSSDEKENRGVPIVMKKTRNSSYAGSEVNNNHYTEEDSRGYMSPSHIMLSSLRIISEDFIYA
ncbi:hypothetical protein KL930_001960 [Ogataea haglerorum]|nr:hypothetical protein KL951_001125 [Ogataea haglerorum]KAG7708520.1 hypothetical protein KL914_002246 [Ogataea haglerorum]KAG7710451.1 hypothetical protein KL950_001364 [Ogataea haglerorum]KAG7721075.1 hypothetical protein KL913_000811 [Ogataea haglerorum]KAG7721829.1 hypothetical protein KL949_000807 [Ogataea haglerorum]